jgi:hypothetical protein
MKKDNQESSTNQLNTDSDPFAPANLRIDQSHLQGGAAKKLILTVPVRKPKKQEYIRVRPEEEYRLTPAGIITLEEDGESYLVASNLANDLGQELSTVTLFMAITRQKTFFLWPVKLPSADGRQIEWHVSAMLAAQQAMRHWVKVVSNRSLGAYEVSVALGNFTEPEWPDLTLQDCLKVAFKTRYINGLDHPVLQKLRGEI